MKTSHGLLVSIVIVLVTLALGVVAVSAKLAADDRLAAAERVSDPPSTRR